jgi:hypothetical protein
MNELDAYLPAYEFSERHRIGIDAPPERIDGAFREVTLAELPVSRMLFALRGLPRSGRFVDRVPGRVLEDVPGEGLVVGLRGQFWRPRGGDDGGPAAEAVADFRLEPSGLATETRVHVPDPAARRRFRRYWRVIRPFSGLIRIEYLRAAKRRAERTA